MEADKNWGTTCWFYLLSSPYNLKWGYSYSLDSLLKQIDVMDVLE